MSDYKIDIVSDVDSFDFYQLKQLIREFAIIVFLNQYSNIYISNKKMDYYIDNYEDLLSNENLILLENDIEQRIEFAKNSISSRDTKKLTRYYILKKGECAIGFQTAQVRIVNDVIEGWRNFAYIIPKFSGQKGIVTDSYCESYEDFLSKVLYDNVTKWFYENSVEIEKTATGKNMYKNILAYIVYLGFIPEKIDEQRVYLVKNYKKKYTKRELKKRYLDFKKGVDPSN